MGMPFRRFVKMGVVLDAGERFCAGPGKGGNRKKSNNDFNNVFFQNLNL